MSDQPDQHEQPESYFNVDDIVIDHGHENIIYMGTVTDVIWIGPVYCYEYNCEYFTYNREGSNTIWIEAGDYDKFGAEHLLEKVGRAADQFGEGGESQWPQEGIVAKSES